MIRRLLCALGAHRLRLDYVCFAWEPATDWVDRWHTCDGCGRRMEYIPTVKD